MFRQLYRACALILLGAFLGSQGAQAASSADDLIQGVLARADTVFSGRIKYRVTIGFPQTKEEKARGAEIVFAASGWRREDNFPVAAPARGEKGKAVEAALDIYQVVSVSHGGKSVEYRATKQQDGTFRRSANVTMAKPLMSEKTAGPPVFAGSLWLDCTREYIQQHKSRVRLLPKSVVGGIDVEIREWDVPPSDRSVVLGGYNPLMSNGGKLRLYVAPSLGFVLPRAEFVAPDGKIAMSYESVLV